MSVKERHIYAGGNTARGYRSFLNAILTGINRRVVLAGDVEGLASSLIEKVGKKAVQLGKQVEWIHSPFVNGAFDGVVIPEWSAAVVDGGYPRQLKPEGPGVIETCVNVQDAVDKQKLVSYQEEIAALLERIEASTLEAHQAFAEALRIHDEWEAVFIAHLDREKANRVGDEVLHLFFGEETQAKRARIRRMYLGAATPAGPKDFVPNLTADASKRYLIKGRPGSGKSTILKRLVAEAERRGFDAEVYHCGLDPNSLDMVVLPEKGLAIFDSTAPHEYFPERDADEVIDMYARAIQPGTDERYQEQIASFQNRYKEATKKGTTRLKAAEDCRIRLASIYREATDESKAAELEAAISNLAGADK
ncbi:hypothetical protein [Brevibacillus borstelensis]|uniref:hypothetical protein n=1 Tax=Brevibacillus borstelensis TaxID=45462 RepID=UPI0030C21C01